MKLAVSTIDRVWHLRIWEHDLSALTRNDCVALDNNEIHDRSTIVGSPASTVQTTR